MDYPNLWLKVNVTYKFSSVYGMTAYHFYKVHQRKHHLKLRLLLLTSALVEVSLFENSSTQSNSISLFFQAYNLSVLDVLHLDILLHAKNHPLDQSKRFPNLKSSIDIFGVNLKG